MWGEITISYPAFFWAFFKKFSSLSLSSAPAGSQRGKPWPTLLEKVKRLDGITFNYKDNPDERMTGVIAQQVKEVLPEAVYDHDKIDGEQTYAVRYGNMIGLLIEGMKEQQKQIDELKEKLESK